MKGDLYWACIQNTSDAVLITDAEARILEVNAAFEKMTGYTASEITGRDPRILRSGKTPPEVFDEMWRALHAKKAWRGRLTNLAKNGQEFVTGLTIAPIFDTSGRTTHYFSVMRDITDSIKADDKIRELTRKREEFLSIATHDLRRPIGNQLMLARLLLDEKLGPMNPRQHEMVARLRSNADYMLELVEDLLSTQVAEAGGMSLYRGAVDIEDLLESCVSRHSLSARDKQIRVETTAEPPPAGFEADGHRLMQAVNNLLSNAIKFSEAGSTVTIRAEPSDGGYVLTVADRGVGIPKEEQSRLFQKYPKTSSRPTSGEKSTGLGLFIVSTIVRLHGGQVGVESSPGEGSTFRIWLPIPQA